MRKLKLQIQTTIDGFVAGSRGEMDWMTFDWSADLLEFVRQLTAPVDAIVLGRHLAQGFIPHWASLLDNPATADAFARRMVETPKIVFTKTLTNSPWPRTEVANGELVTEINRLKSQPGGDLIVYGGGTLVSALIQQKLIDELHLFINPAILGHGMPIFQQVSAKQGYRLVQAQAFACGIVVVSYVPDLLAV